MYICSFQLSNYLFKILLLRFFFSKLRVQEINYVNFKNRGYIGYTQHTVKPMSTILYPFLLEMWCRERDLGILSFPNLSLSLCSYCKWLISSSVDRARGTVPGISLHNPICVVTTGFCRRQESLCSQQPNNPLQPTTLGKVIEFYSLV